MCGRFNLIDEYDYVAELFGCKDALKFPKRYNIAPSQPVVIIKNQLDGPADTINKPMMQLVKWGFIADWMKAPPNRLIINARSETVCQKSMFRGAIEQNRCIIPASGWYEWKVIRGVKQPFYMTKDLGKTNNSLFAFAGIFSRFMAADGSEIDTMALLTRPAIGQLDKVHHRMPCILPEDKYNDWLNGWDIRGRNAIDLFEDNVDKIKLHPVHTDVGIARLDKACFIDEIELENKVAEKENKQLDLF